MLATVDWTVITCAFFTLLATAVTAWATVATKRAELRAAQEARHAAEHAAQAKRSADSVRPLPRKRKKPPTHPDG